MGELVERLFRDIEDRHPRSVTGIREAQEIDPTRFEEIAEMYLQWAVKSRGQDWIPAMVDAFEKFSSDVIFAQARYESDGSYEAKTFAECHANTYGRKGVMDNYLWGVYLTNFLWSHHMEICLFFQDRFLKKLADDSRIVEIAPGHGGWGLLALEKLPAASLEGYDVSPSSIDTASTVAKGAGLATRSTYKLKNALDLDGLEHATADAVICSFLIEHLEAPEKLLANIAALLKDNQYAFITGALTAAQIDHIYEFKRESELLTLSEEHGLRVLESLSSSPRRTLPKARFLPRSMAMIVQKTRFI